MPNSIISLSKRDMNQTGDILAKIFFNDPITVHGLPDEEKRKKVLKYAFRTMVLVGIKYGEVYATSTNLEGICVLVHFTKYKPLTMKFLWCGIKSKIYKIGIKSSIRFGVFDKYMNKNHKKWAPGSHWYIQNLGVKPKFQGKGIGTNLMKKIIERADKLNLPLYLETEKEINVKFYQKLGFKVMNELDVPNMNVKLWFMLRSSNIL